MNRQFSAIIDRCQPRSRAPRRRKASSYVVGILAVCAVGVPALSADAATTILAPVPHIQAPVIPHIPNPVLPGINAPTPLRLPPVVAPALPPIEPMTGTHNLGLTSGGLGSVSRGVDANIPALAPRLIAPPAASTGSSPRAHLGNVNRRPTWHHMRYARHASPLLLQPCSAVPPGRASAAGCELPSQDDDGSQD